jgi:Cu+-exporting ATPase
VLELRAREATSGAIRALLDMAPKTARRVKDDGSDEEVSLDDLQVGDRLRTHRGRSMMSTQLSQIAKDSPEQSPVVRAAVCSQPASDGLRR